MNAFRGSDEQNPIDRTTKSNASSLSSPYSSSYLTIKSFVFLSSTISESLERTYRISCSSFACLIYLSKHYPQEVPFRKIYQNHRKLSALSIATWFSILAPLSWFVIFKGHSYIHTHMNYITWHMPFTLLGFALFGLVGFYLVSEILEVLHNRWFQRKG